MIIASVVRRSLPRSQLASCWGCLSSTAGRPFFSTPVSSDLREFLDLEEVPEGQPRPIGSEWKAEQLRAKSWDDLHKLWFVLLKERNMLKSEQLMWKARRQPMPTPRRITKVRKSMNRIKQVLSQRAHAQQNESDKQSMLQMINAL